MQSFKQIVAPFDGIDATRNTDVGALINAGSTAGQEPFEVSDLHPVRIDVQGSAGFHRGSGSGPEGDVRDAAMPGSSTRPWSPRCNP
jgi:membrane fusion protein, multidrug efflux system